MRKSSAHSVIRLFIVSEPMLFTFPETPDVPFVYAGSVGSTLTPCAMVIPAKTSVASPTMPAVSVTNGLRVILSSLLESPLIESIEPTGRP